MAVLALLGCALCAMIVALWSIRLWMQWSTGIRSSTQRPSMLRRFGPPAPEHVPQDWKSLYIQVNDIFQIIARKCALSMDHNKKALGQALHQRCVGREISWFTSHVLVLQTSTASRVACCVVTRHPTRQTPALPAPLDLSSSAYLRSKWHCNVTVRGSPNRQRFDDCSYPAKTLRTLL